MWLYHQEYVSIYNPNSFAIILLFFNCRPVKVQNIFVSASSLLDPWESDAPVVTANIWPGALGGCDACSCSCSSFTGRTTPSMWLWMWSSCVRSVGHASVCKPFICPIIQPEAIPFDTHIPVESPNPKFAAGAGTRWVSHSYTRMTHANFPLASPTPEQPHPHPHPHPHPLLTAMCHASASRHLIHLMP